MKFPVFIAAALLAAAATAKPFGAHQRQHIKNHVKPRDPMVIVTEVVSTTEIVGVTTTIWVTPGQIIPTEAAPALVVASSSASVAESPAATLDKGAQFLEPAVEASSSVDVAPAPTSTYVPPPPPPSSTSVYVPPVETFASQAAPSQAAPVVESSTTVASAAATTPASSSSGSSGECSKGSECSGKVTYYEPDVGITSCGIDGIAGDSEKIVALAATMMTKAQTDAGVTDPNKNPLCGKMITVVYGGKSVVAKVVDTCPGCAAGALDLSHAAIAEVMPDYLTKGHDIMSWYFN
ncbi:putative allergen Asp f 7 [Amylocarpus encephaloides]|uniref:Allergen Asp f 7 n=1 Tax=Amylocarpus encephaloides TaxID=45428 RepID=A0A9P7YR24_9HELO|nr:putative allergen Asp f 7 [Amylocarpus encephaloides]